MKPNKYTYYRVIQGHYGHGWDDLAKYNSSNQTERKDCKRDYKSYRENESIPLRIVSRRVLNK